MVLKVNGGLQFTRPHKKDQKRLLIEVANDIP